MKNSNQPLLKNTKEPITTECLIDLENILYTLWRGYYRRTSIPKIADAIRIVLREHGYTPEIAAFGDYKVLSKIWRCNVQKKLCNAGVTVHSIRCNGEKNCSDKHIKQAISLSLRENDHLETVIIGSGDGHFCKDVEQAQSLGKRVVVLAFSSSLSAELKHLADEVILLDSLLGLEGGTTIDPRDVIVVPTLKLIRAMKRQKWGFWLHKNNVADILNDDELKILIAENVLARGSTNNRHQLHLNTEHPAVCAAECLLTWFNRTINEHQEKREWDHVSIAHLQNLIGQNSICIRLGLTRQSNAAELWVHALRDAGIATLGWHPHPRKQGIMRLGVLLHHGGKQTVEEHALPSIQPVALQSGTLVEQNKKAITTRIRSWFRFVLPWRQTGTDR